MDRIELLPMRCYLKELMQKSWVAVFNSFLRLSVAVIGLLSLQLITQALPMMRDLPAIVPLILNVSILTVLIGVMIWFGIRLRSQLSTLVKTFPVIGSMTLLLTGFVSILIAYFAYREIVTPQLGQLAWVYPLTFLVLAIGTLSALIVLAFTNIDKLTNLTTRRVLPAEQNPQSSSPALNQCLRCGSTPEATDFFCGVCGQRLGPASSSVPSQQ